MRLCDVDNNVVCSVKAVNGTSMVSRRLRDLGFVCDGRVMIMGRFGNHMQVKIGNTSYGMRGSEAKLIEVEI